MCNTIINCSKGFHRLKNWRIMSPNNHFAKWQSSISSLPQQVQDEQWGLQHTTHHLDFSLNCFQVDPSARQTHIWEWVVHMMMMAVKSCCCLPDGLAGPWDPWVITVEARGWKCKMCSFQMELSAGETGKPALTSWICLAVGSDLSLPWTSQSMLKSGFKWVKCSLTYL